MISSCVPDWPWESPFCLLGFHYNIIYNQLVGWISNSSRMAPVGLEMLSQVHSHISPSHPSWSQHMRHRSGWCSELCLSVFLSVFVLRIPNMLGFEIHSDAHFTLEKVRFFSNKKRWKKTCLKIPPAVWQMAVLQLVQANVFDSVRPAAKVPPQGPWNFCFENQVSAANELSSALQIAEPAPKVVERW